MNENMTKELKSVLNTKNGYVIIPRQPAKGIIDQVNMEDAAKQLYDAANPIDILTVTDKMRALGTFEEAGGAYRVTELSGRVASSVHA